MSFEPEAVRAFEHAGWQRAAAQYDGTFSRATAQFIAPLLDAAEVSQGTRVLDVACGPGYLAAAAAARGAMAHGLDFSAEMVAVARAMHPGIVVTEGDAEKLPYPDGTFDALVSGFGLHHVPRPEMALSEACRVLAPRGHVAFTVWANPEENIGWKLVYDAVDRHGDRSAARAMPPGGSFATADDCLRALERAGFVETSAHLAKADWALADADALIAAFSAGTVRMAAVIAAQQRSAMPAIIADIARHAERYRRGDNLVIPLGARLARGKRAR